MGKLMQVKTALKRPRMLLLLVWVASLIMLGAVYLAPREYVPSADWWILVSFLTWLYAVIFPLFMMFRSWKDYRKERDRRQARTSKGPVLK